MDIKVTPAELQMIIDGLRDRVDKLYNMADMYKNAGNVEMQKDFYAESRDVLALYEKLQKLNK